MFYSLRIMPPTSICTREMLASSRFEIRLSVAIDGVEAMELLNASMRGAPTSRPTLILLDLNLPRKDGRQVLAIIKSDDIFRRIPVIVLSSSDSQMDITNCYDLGANCYIVKPSELRTYRDIVRTLEDFGWFRRAAAARWPLGSYPHWLRTIAQSR